MASPLDTASQSVTTVRGRDIGTWLNTLGSNRSSQPQIDTAGALRALHDRINDLQKNLQAVVAYLDAAYAAGLLDTPATATAGTTTSYQTLTADAAGTFDPPTSEGQRHVHLLRQDGTGGWDLTGWAAGINWAPTELGDTSADICYLFDFVALINEDNGDALEWFCTGFNLVNELP